MTDRARQSIDAVRVFPLGVALLVAAHLTLGGCPNDAPLTQAYGVSNRVSGFDPRANGLHFNNEFPPGSVYFPLTLPGLGTVYSSDAHDGMCDGFVLTVLDLFLHEPPLIPPADTAPPALDTPLFGYLAQREVDCFFYAGLRNFWKAAEWVHTPSGDTDVDTPLGRVVTTRGLAWHTIVEEWPWVKEDIDAGRPSPLWLVTTSPVPAADLQQTITALTNHHQVLAYAYSLDDAATLTLSIYEPQRHDSACQTVTLNIANPECGAEIAVPSLAPTVVRGFFRSAYEFRDASSIAPN
jgi:hypothetical protein